MKTKNKFSLIKEWFKKTQGYTLSPDQDKKLKALCKSGLNHPIAFAFALFKIITPPEDNHIKEVIIQSKKGGIIMT